MNDYQGARISKYLELALISAPIIALSVMAISWLVYGIDLPYWDDWVALGSGKIGSLKLSYLFQPMNDTMFPVGRVLDALAFRYLNNNSVAYQFLSMTMCLGTLMFLQWQLLKSAITNRAVVIGGFALTIFMMQPGSYWGLQNMAYHQVLPLISILAILVVATKSFSGRIASGALCFIFGVIGGLSYISGAISVATAAIVFAVFCFRHRRLVPIFVGTALAALVTLPLQLWVVIGVNKGEIHTHTPWVLPTDVHFWLYFAGKIARAFSLQYWYPRFSAPVILVAVLILLFFTLRAVSRLRSKREKSSDDLNRDIIVSTLTAVVFVYLAAVTASRAGLISADFTTSAYGEMYTYGFGRFHFFWVTALIPWIFVIACTMLPTRIQGQTSLVAGIALVVFALASGAADNPSDFKKISDERSLTAIACIQQKLLANEEMNCSGLYPNPVQNFDIGRKRGLSYARYFPPVLDENGYKMRAMSAKLGPSAAEVISPDFELANATKTIEADGVVTISGASDPNLMIVGNRDEMDTCHHLVVRASVTPAISGPAQLFYLPKEIAGYNEQNSKTQMLNAGVANSVMFDVFSQDGFEPRFRFDPVSQPQVFKVGDLTYYCDF